MLKGKTAVITGASRGIGKAIALKLASGGANVALIYAGNEQAALEVCKEAENKGVKAAVFQCNVEDFAQVKQTVSDIKSLFGTIDILVNNAGITRDALVMMMKESDFDDVINTNLKGAFNMIRHCSPVFVKNKKGKIINISSISGIMGNAGQANYSASKAGLIGLTKTIARELAPKNVCCNAIAPGMIQTDMTADFSVEHPMIKQIPLGRIGRVEDVAELAAFLADDISDYITGEVIRVDGGMAI